MSEALRSNRIQDEARRAFAMQPIELDDEAIEILETAASAPAIQLLETLAPNQREAIEARHLEERGYAEIAAELRCSEIKRASFADRLAKVFHRVQWEHELQRVDDDGETQLDGRTVERIRIDPPSACPFPGCPREPAYAYVDPQTFYPVEEDCHCGVIALPGGPVVRLRLVRRYLTFEYLPRTAANLALADIRAQHPNATVDATTIPSNG